MCHINHRVMERYPNNGKLLRVYGKFLEDVKHDVPAAQRVYAEVRACLVAHASQDSRWRIAQIAQTVVCRGPSGRYSWRIRASCSES